MGMKIPPILATSYAPQFNTIYDKLAADNKMAFVPFFFKGRIWENRTLTCRTSFIRRLPVIELLPKTCGRF